MHFNRIETECCFQEQKTNKRDAGRISIQANEFSNHTMFQLNKMHVGSLCNNRNRRKTLQLQAATSSMQCHCSMCDSSKSSTKILETTLHSARAAKQLTNIFHRRISICVNTASFEFSNSRQNVVDSGLAHRSSKSKCWQLVGDELFSELRRSKIERASAEDFSSPF